MTEPSPKNRSNSVGSQGSSHRAPRPKRSTSLIDTPRCPDAATRSGLDASRLKERSRSLQDIGGERRSEAMKANVVEKPASAEEKLTPDTSGQELRRSEATTCLLRTAQRSPGKTCLLNASYMSLVGTILVAILIGLITFRKAQSYYHKRRLQPQESVSSTHATRCHNDACRRIEELLKDAIDLRAQPCDDFHAYVCGSWSRTHPGLTVAQDITRTFLGNITQRARNTLTLFPDASSRQTAVQKAARHFVACDNIVAASEDQSEEVRKVLQKGGIVWPNRAPEESAPCVLKAIFYMSQVIKIPVLLDVSTERAAKRQVVIRKPESVDVLLNDVKRHVKGTAFRSHEHYFRIVYGNFSRSDDSANVKERFRNIVRLEQALTSFLGPPARIKKYENNDTWLTDTANVHHVSRAISKECWLEAFKVFMTIPKKRRVPVVIHAGFYFRALFSLHEKLGETDFVELYAWLCVQALVPFSSGRIIAARHVGSRGSALETHRWYCFSSTDRVLHYALEHPYMSHFTTAEIQEDVDKLMQELKQSFAKVLQRTASQSVANKCFAHFEKNLADGHAEFFRRSKPEYFEDIYAHYPDMTSSAMTNWLRTAEFIPSPVVSGYWSGSQRSTTDMNYPLASTKLVEASYLDIPLYSLRVPSAIKFAGIGSRLFKNGLYVGRTSHVCHEAVLEHSDDTLECLKNTHKDQIAKFEAIKTDTRDAMLSWTVLWTAFRAFAESKTNETVLQNFPRLSQSALFFIMGCLLTCGEPRNVAEALCNLPLRHDENFATAFSCTQDSAMRPRNQCPGFFAA